MTMLLRGECSPRGRSYVRWPNAVDLDCLLSSQRVLQVQRAFIGGRNGGRIRPRRAARIHGVSVDLLGALVAELSEPDRELAQRGPQRLEPGAPRWSAHSRSIAFTSERITTMALRPRSVTRTTRPFGVGASWRWR